MTGYYVVCREAQRTTYLYAETSREAGRMATYTKENTPDVEITIIGYDTLHSRDEDSGDPEFGGEEGLVVPDPYSDKSVIWNPDKDQLNRYLHGDTK